MSAVWQGRRPRVISRSAAFAWSEAQADARARTGNRDPLRLLAGAIGAADAVLVFLLSMVAYTLRHGLSTIPVEITTASVLASLLVVNVLSILGAYGAHVRDGLIPQTWRAVQAWSLVFVLFLVYGYLTKTLEDYSRVWSIVWYFSVAFGLASVRLAASVQLRRWHSRGRLSSTVAIVDLAGRSAAFQRRLTENRSDDVRIVGVFSRDDSSRPRCGITDLIALSRLFRIDEVVVLVSDATDTSTTNDLPGILRRLGTIPTNVRICPSLPDLQQTPIRGTQLVHEIPMLTVHQRPLGAWSSVAKRTEDVLIGGIALLILWPVLLIVAIAVRIDSPGPILFRQARQGFNNNVIMVLKFRTMHHARQSNDVVIQATRNDRRVTRVGRLLRRTSLDELPQLFNVLVGDMSLVGPRPHAVAHNQQYAALIDDYLGRHRVQPGITGWAQVNGLRGETDTLDKMQRRVEFDLAYINNWSIGLDLKILVLTAVTILFDRQAY